MSAHSKGQWVLDECDPHSRVTIYSGETVICDYVPTYIEYGTDEEVVANFHLIAQAPAMHEALTYCEDILMRYEINRVDGDAITDEALTKIRTILAAARGDSHE